MLTAADRIAAFRRLHERGCFVIPNGRGDFPRRGGKGGPRAAGERGAHADAARAELGEIGDAQVGSTAHEHVDGLGRDGSNDGADRLAVAQARSVEDVGARLGVGREATNGLRQGIRVADEEAFGAGGEEHARLRLVYGAARRLHALDGLGELVERTCVFTRSVLDRQTGDSRPHAEGDALRYVLGAVAVSGLEIGVHRERRRLDDVRDVAEHHVSRQGQRRVGQGAREREAGARRGQRWKPELREEDGRAPVPGGSSRGSTVFSRPPS
jgi:hypothetical protein